MCLYDYRENITYCSERACNNPFCFRNLNYTIFEKGIRYIFPTSDFKDSSICDGFIDKHPYVLIQKENFIDNVVSHLQQDGNSHEPFVKYIVNILNQELENSKEE